MIDDGHAFGNMVATKHLLKLLVRKGTISRADVRMLHDEAQAELQKLLDSEAIAPKEAANSARAIGFLYVLD